MTTTLPAPAVVRLSPAPLGRPNPVTDEGSPVSLLVRAFRNHGRRRTRGDRAGLL